MPEFFRRQVLVKVAPGAKTVPSGIVTSRMNWAWSQTGVGGAEKVAVGRARVGKLAAVLVAAGGGMVGVLKGVTCVVENVDIACTVSAAAVNTALGSSVAGLLDGRLQAGEDKYNNEQKEYRADNLKHSLSPRLVGQFYTPHVSSTHFL